MFKVDDVLKTNMQVAEDHYAGCKGTQVYENMIKAAKKYRFKVINVTTSEYELLRVQDGVSMVRPKKEVEEYFELVTEPSGEK